MEVTESHIYTDPVSEAICPKCGEVLGVEGLAAFTNVECHKCAHEFQVPAKFGPFLLLELLGAGGMGGVYLARDEGLKREVAIKVMLQSLGDDIDFVATFQREAQAAAKLNNPHIAQIYSFGQQYGQPYIVMELVSNGSLEDMMKEQGGVDPATAIHVGEQIADGLREAAEAGLVHGDVKPENILFDNEDNAKLVDFGLVALSSGNANEVWGTPFYIAPEKVRRAKSDYRSDIYSLGATIYHAIANKPPFDGIDATAVVKARFEGPPMSLSEATGQEIPAEVEKLIARMLEVDPAKRYPTYGSLMGDMKRYLSKAGPLSLKKSSRRIKIKGKNAMKFNRKKKGMNVTGKIVQNGSSSAGKKEVKPYKNESGGCKKASLIGCSVVFGIFIIVAVIGGLFFLKVKNNIEAKMKEMEQSQQNSIQTGANAIAAAVKSTKKIHDMEPGAVKYVEDAANLVVAVYGEEVRARMIPPEPEYNVVGAYATNGGSGAVSNTVTGATNAVVAVNKEVVPVQEPDSDDPKFIAVVRSMYKNLYAVRLAGVAADRLVSELEASAAKLQNMDEMSLANIPFKFTIQDDLPIAAEFQGMDEIAKAMFDKASNMARNKEIKDGISGLKSIVTTFKSIESELKSLAEQKRRDAIQKQKDDVATAAAEKKRVEAEVAKEKAQNEIASIAVAEAECVESLKNLRFRDALRRLSDVSYEIESDEAKAALVIAKERVNRLESFHKYLIKNTPGFKSASGWTIQSADKKYLTVGSTKVTWKELYAKRPKIVNEFIKALVQSKEAKKDMRLREHTRLMTNAALFLFTYYPDMPTAQVKAEKIAKDAVTQFDADADIIKTLLPKLFEDAL